MRLRSAGSARPALRRPPVRSEDGAKAALVALAYELLDAHADTAALAGDGATSEQWAHHVAYLRDLQRVGREALARTGRSRY
jgi:hypothetical protein